MQKRIPLLLLVLGLVLLAYPGLSSGASRHRQEDTLSRYQSTVTQMSPGSRTELLVAAGASQDPGPLSVDETGIIGCVTVPALDIQLPIYPGTSEAELCRGAGLLEGASLPLGGNGCHSVLSAHRGLPEARLFRDLDKLKVGDTFTVTVLDRVLTYRVDRITVAEPDDTRALLPEEGSDLCTLLTCTPYGINSHRLLVRGCRTDPP